MLYVGFACRGQTLNLKLLAMVVGLSEIENRSAKEKNCGAKVRTGRWRREGRLRTKGCMFPRENVEVKGGPDCNESRSEPVALLRRGSSSLTKKMAPGPLMIFPEANDRCFRSSRRDAMHRAFFFVVGLLHEKVTQDDTHCHTSKVACMRILTLLRECPKMDW